MNTLLDTPAARCAQALATAARAPVTLHGPATWCLPGVPGEAPRLARLTDDWLELASGPLLPGPQLGPATGLPERLLRWNATLAGNTRFGVNARFELSLRADVAWHDEIDPAPRVEAGLAGLDQGPALLAGVSVEAAVVTGGSNATVDLAEVVTAAGWKCYARQDGRFDFPLDEADATRLASARVRDDGSVRVWLPVASWNGLGDLPRRALSILLLRAGAALRLARPVLLGEDAAAVAELEVHLQSAPGPVELALALDSLAVGAATLLAETKLLCHPQIAKEFLEVGEWASSPEPEISNHNHQPKEPKW